MVKGRTRGLIGDKRFIYSLAEAPVLPFGMEGAGGLTGDYRFIQLGRGSCITMGQGRDRGLTGDY